MIYRTSTDFAPKNRQPYTHIYKATTNPIAEHDPRSGFNLIAQQHSPPTTTKTDLNTSIHFTQHNISVYMCICTYVLSGLTLDFMYLIHIALYMTAEEGVVGYAEGKQSQKHKAKTLIKNNTYHSAPE